jgi:hypothetical protein
LPRAGVLAQPIIEAHRIALQFGDFGLHDDFSAVWLLAGDLQLFARIAVEPVGICRRTGASLA